MRRVVGSRVARARGLPRREREHAHGRGVPRRGRRHRRSAPGRARALRIAERLVRDVASTHDWRVAEHFDAAWTAAAGLQPRRGAPPVPAVRRHARPRPRVVAPPASATRGRRAGCSRPPRGCSHARSRTAGTTTAGSSTRPTSTGNRSSRTGCTGCSRKAIGAAATLHAVTGDARTYDRWYQTFWDFADAWFRDRRGRKLDGTSSTTDSSRANARGRESRTSTTRSRRRCIPRLPVTPSLAGALRGGLLDR